jgi:hypothetical protein
MKRFVTILALVVLIGLGGVGAWLVFRGETEEDRVVQSFEALKGAVETRDVELVARYLHEEYGGWGGDRTSALQLFRDAIQNYSDARIEIRERKVVLSPDGAEANVDFEWTYRATLRSEIQTISREQMDRLPSNLMPWEGAKAVFRKDENGRWTLQWIDTRIPRFRG